LICGITDFDHKFDFDGKTSWVDYVDNVFPMSFEISFTAAVQHSHPLGRIDGGNFAGAEPTPMPFPYGLGGSGRSVPEDIALSTGSGRAISKTLASIDSRLKRIASIDRSLGGEGGEETAFQRHGPGTNGAAEPAITGDE
jgi:hypothetical protein